MTVAKATDGDLAAAIVDQLRETMGQQPADATPEDVLAAVSLAVRSLLTRAMLETEQRRSVTKPKRIYYLSLEFLIGRLRCTASRAAAGSRAIVRSASMRTRSGA